MRRNDKEFSSWDGLFLFFWIVFIGLLLLVLAILFDCFVLGGSCPTIT